MRGEYFKAAFSSRVRRAEWRDKHSNSFNGSAFSVKKKHCLAAGSKLQWLPEAAIPPPENNWIDR